MTYLLIEIGTIEMGCVDCTMNAQSNTCKAGFARSPMPVIRRGNIRFFRSKQCIKAVMPSDCRTCIFRKVLLSNNWCRWFRLQNDAELECTKKRHKYWMPFSKENIQRDQLEEFERLEDL